MNEFCKLVAKDLMRRIKDPSIGQRERWKMAGIGVDHANVLSVAEKWQAPPRIRTQKDRENQTKKRIASLEERHSREMEAALADFPVGTIVGKLTTISPPTRICRGRLFLYAKCSCGKSKAERFVINNLRKMEHPECVMCRDRRRYRKSRRLEE